jgi:hypothetical protein
MAFVYGAVPRGPTQGAGGAARRISRPRSARRWSPARPPCARAGAPAGRSPPFHRRPTEHGRAIHGRAGGGVPACQRSAPRALASTPSKPSSLPTFPSHAPRHQAALLRLPHSRRRPSRSFIRSVWCTPDGVLPTPVPRPWVCINQMDRMRSNDVMIALNRKS